MTDTFDFTQEDAWSDALILGPGIYRVKVEDVDLGESSGGHPEVRLQLRARSGGELRDWQAITSSTLGRWLQICDAFGIARPGQISVRDDNGNPTTEWAQHVAQLGNKEAWIYVVQGQKNDGTPRSEIQFYSANQPGPEGPNALMQTGGEVPADTRGLTQAQPAQDERVPF